MLGAPPGTIPRCGVCGRHRQSDEARKGNRSHREHGFECWVGTWDLNQKAFQLLKKKKKLRKNMTRSDLGKICLG